MMTNRNSPPNKGTTKYGDVIDRINRMLESSPEPVEIKDIFTHLVAVGVFQDTLNEYQKLGRILKTHRDNGRIDRDRIVKATTRGRNGKHPYKFKIGDKVRIDRHCGRLPLEFCDRLRLDRPRTITAVFREPGNTKTFYYLGSNRLGDDLLECYHFRVDMLVPYKANKVGRPRVKRRYLKSSKGNHRGSEINARTLIVVGHQSL